MFERVHGVGRELGFKGLAHKGLGTGYGRGNIRDIGPTHIAHGSQCFYEYLFGRQPKTKTFVAMLNVQGDELVKVELSFVLCFKRTRVAFRQVAGQNLRRVNLCRARRGFDGTLARCRSVVANDFHLFLRSLYGDKQVHQTGQRVSFELG